MLRQLWRGIAAWDDIDKYNFRETCNNKKKSKHASKLKNTNLMCMLYMNKVSSFVNSFLSGNRKMRGIYMVQKYTKDNNTLLALQMSRKVMCATLWVQFVYIGCIRQLTLNIGYIQSIKTNKSNMLCFK